jgi:hypothetical protein
MIAALVFLILMVTILGLAGILTYNRQELARIAAHRPTTDSAEVAAMRRELQELKEMVHTQMLALDVYATSRQTPPTDDRLQERISR